MFLGGAGKNKCKCILKKNERLPQLVAAGRGEWVFFRSGSRAWLSHTPVEGYTPKDIWKAQTGLQKNKIEIKTQNWMDREEGVGLGGVGRGVKMIKIHCLKFSKNRLFLKSENTTKQRTKEAESNLSRGI